MACNTTMGGKTFTSFKKELGNDIYLTAGRFQNKKVVGIRKYGTNAKGHQHPTKAGVSMSPGRFASLVAHIEQIDEAYSFVYQTEGEWRTIHLGGRLYASVACDYEFINLRQFFKVFVI